MRVNVLVIAGLSYPPSHTPGATYLADATRALTRAKYRVKVLCWKQKVEPYADEVIWRPTTNAIEKSGRIVALLWTIWLILRRRNEFDIAVINITMFWKILPLLVLIRTLNKSLVMTSPGNPFKEWTDGRLSQHYPIQTKIAIPFLLPMFNCADVIFTMPDFKHILVTMGVPSEKIVSAIPPVDATAFKPIDKLLKNNVVACYGVLMRERGIDFLIKSFCRVLKKRSDAQLWLLGKGPEIEDLKDDVKKLGLTESIKFLGWVPREQVPQALAEVGIIINPRPFGIGLSYPTVEAMAMGKAIISTRFNEVTEEFLRGDPGKEKGILVPIQDENCMTEAILTLLNNPQMVRELGLRGKEFVTTEATHDAYSRAWAKVIDIINNKR